ncbi:BrxA/BrxB family bacilliredoxin [Macrococcoides caseolyticum]|uniref:BrxA/BrxB family bacilliredoxin n=1 Tax=Macrococcoides caseolyticum TaxID=69966 RepID=UPI001F38D2E4|nr:BrxA/BrxB family bacilliredoxin [Macrococcus caseolyticus]MCE4957027.1 BrxA/BrxB family bacilliredoxin [Macrococcus caseolyticus]
MNAYEEYMKSIADGMRKELTEYGFNSLETSEAVEEYFNQLKDETSTFVVVNSVCGCAAGLARPAAVTVATQNDNKPDQLVTVFAGQDKEATDKMREYIAQVPSSPSMALFKGKNLVAFMPREHIEGRPVEEICMDLKEYFDVHC